MTRPMPTPGKVIARIGEVKEEWLKFAESSIGSCDDQYYSLDQLRSKFEVTELVPGSGWLVVHRPEPEFWTSFAVVQFATSDGDDKNIEVAIVFRGEGTGGVLRECRHTYWGPDGKGYIFYPNGRVIAAAFKELSKYFDDMV